MLVFGPSERRSRDAKEVTSGPCQLSLLVRCPIVVGWREANLPSRIMELRFTHSESTFTYFAATRAYLERHGKPVAFYSDKASVFRVNKQGATSGNGHTQFARALFELNIEGICANSSQANMPPSTDRA